MAPFLIALVIAAIIALLCHPWYRKLDRYMPHWIASLLVTLGVTVLVLAPLVFVGINVTYQLITLIKGIKLPSFDQLANLSEHPFVTRYIHRLPEWIPVDKAWMQEQALTVGQRALEALSGILTAFVGGLPGLLLQVCVVVVSVYFFLVDGARLVRFLGTISPLPPEKSRGLFFAFSDACIGTVLGMFASAAVQGFLIGVTFAIASIPHPILWGSIGVIMGMVPVIGVMPVTVGAIIYGFANGDITTGIIALVGAGIVGFSDNIVRPWVLKGHGEMHPLLGLVSAFGAVAVLGPSGIILGPVIAALFVAFLEILSSDMKNQSGASLIAP